MTNHQRPEQDGREEVDVAVSTRRWSVIWLPGLAVAIGAAVATAHGLYEVAAASRVPQVIAWLYPLITDGLALVAYAATARLTGSAARYAWAVVVVAAGLSGLAQAVFLAGEDEALTAPASLRFVIGAWPAIAAAVVAHLLYLLAETSRERASTAAGADEQGAQRSVVAGVQRSDLSVQPEQGERLPVAVQSPALDPAPVAVADPDPTPRSTGVGPSGEQVERDGAGGPPARAVAAPSPARDRALDHAITHYERHHTWPTVTELQEAAGVSRGTAAAALKALRDAADTDPGPETAPIPLHLIHTNTQPAPHQHFHEQSKKTQP